MDPAGIREVLLLRPYVLNPYLIEYNGRHLPFKTRFYPFQFNIPWLPLDAPLVRRVSTISEGWHGLLHFDLAILAGVDLQSCEERDILNLRSAAERGLPLLVCGGPFGLGSSYRLWTELEPVLPARIPVCEPQENREEVRSADQHPVLEGLPSSFGPIGSVHPLDVADDATVLLAAGGEPVLVAGERAGSRQLILAVAAAEGLSCDGIDSEGFYGHPAYPDLIRQCLQWLMRLETPLSFKKLEMKTGYTLAEPGRHEFEVRASCEDGVEDPMLRFRLFRVDEGRLMVGGDTVAAEILREETHQITDGRSLSFEVEDLLAGRHTGLYEVELDLEMKDPPKMTPPLSFGMHPGPTFDNWKGNAVDRRRFRLRFPDRRRSSVYVPGRTSAIIEGHPWRAAVSSPGPVEATLTVTDALGSEVSVVTGSGSNPELEWVVPPLVHGQYKARLDIGSEGGETETFEFLLLTSRPTEMDDGFQIVGHSGYLSTEETECRSRLDAYLNDFGLDTISAPGMKSADILMDPEQMWNRPLEQEDSPEKSTQHLRRLPRFDALAAHEGRHLWIDFDAPLVLLKTHGATEEYDPTRPCVLSPYYEAAVRELLAPRLEFLRTRPRFLSAEIIDEPHLYPSNVCRCDICLAAYRERYGEDMPQWEELRDDRSARRWHFYEWLGNYTALAFKAAYKVKQEIAPEIHVHNTAIDRLFVSDFMFNGMHRWAEFGDELYMACYPFSYLNNRGRDQAPHCQTHWIAAWIRGLATHYGKTWGVFMELWEHDTPNRWMPAYWCVGQFYALLAEGADRMDTFLAVFNNEHFSISWDRLKEFGCEIKKVRPYLPLLRLARRPRARIAFMNPWCEWIMNPQPRRLPPGHEGYGYYRRYHLPFDDWYPSDRRRMLAYELFHRTFRDLDQVDETLLCEQGFPYEAVVVEDCRFMIQQTMKQICEYVCGGGILILDCEPDRTETGERLSLLGLLAESSGLKGARLTPDDFEDCTSSSGTLIPGLSYRVFKIGKGQVLFFSANIQNAYADALEDDREGIRNRLERGVADLLADLGLRSRFVTTEGDVDVGLRFGDGWALAPMANLGTQTRHTVAAIEGLDFTPGFVVNLTDGLLLEPECDDGALRVNCDLESHHGALIAIYPAAPRVCGVKPKRASSGRGADLDYEVILTNADGKPAAGAFAVYITVSDPDGAEHPSLGGCRVVDGGSLQIHERVPVNAVSGEWTVRVEELITGVSGQARFGVT